MRPAAILAIVFTIPFQLRAALPSPAAKLFVDSCSSCHTIGGGDLAGPDLKVVARWKPDDLRKAVKRMEENAGALTADQIDALVVMLQAPDVNAQLAALNAPAIEISPEEKAASAETGGHLFFGEATFANRGTPCFACHTVAGRGGNLAADLSTMHAKLGDSAILASAQQPAIALMKATYTAHPITKQEAYHLLAFLKAPPPATTPPTDRAGVVHGFAGGLAVAVLAGVGIVFRRRNHRSGR